MTSLVHPANPEFSNGTGILNRFVHILADWVKRQKALAINARELRTLSDYHLRDIGLTKADVAKLTGMPNIHF